jgi:hypothetical protein
MEDIGRPAQLSYRSKSYLQKLGARIKYKIPQVLISKRTPETFTYMM